MEKLLNIAIIGCGNLMYHFVYDCMKRMPFRLAAVSHTNEAELNRFTDRYVVPKVYRDHNDMLKHEQLDAVICFPTDVHSHYTIAKDCLLAHTHVFMERPPCLTMEQARDLLDLQNHTQKYVMTRFNKRFTTAYMMAKEIIERDEFGSITMYMSKFQGSESASDEAFLFNHVSHHIDLARYLLGEIKSVHVDKVKVNDHMVGFNISFITDSSAIGVIQSGSLQKIEYPMERVEITGIGSNVIVDNIRHLEYNRPAPKRDGFQLEKLVDGGDTLLWNPNHGNMSNFSYYGFEHQMHHFITSILNHAVPTPNMQDTIHTIELLEQINTLIQKE
ncbi:Gfo/Idh/MocA family protein [Paenibacillus agricola]|uniref:Gfo/Idh/MocA family oxidoreductase n=1 Tax=Paenibacillus agricola TaxID=2716264 RepID=A0ABX0JFI1_9BACL|nr:Gfo/Idh/MocA family oxidoreductase [Paenibacillus agricola]NHN32979.1 Gfo/Idh/MocA family oxidoreductase [Paenibacillus agricola]